MYFSLLMTSCGSPKGRGLLNYGIFLLSFCGKSTAETDVHSIVKLVKCVVESTPTERATKRAIDRLTVDRFRFYAHRTITVIVCLRRQRSDSKSYSREKWYLCFHFSHFVRSSIYLYFSRSNIGPAVDRLLCSLSNGPRALCVHRRMEWSARTKISIGAPFTLQSHTHAATSNVWTTVWLQAVRVHNK